jgi:hypothetical protein
MDYGTIVCNKLIVNGWMISLTDIIEIMLIFGAYIYIYFKVLK